MIRSFAHQVLAALRLASLINSSIKQKLRAHARRTTRRSNFEGDGSFWFLVHLQTPHASQPIDSSLNQV
ncbi:uncharacterized protein PHALS_02642 [Plasmopara halstedii]|uniref:Uncharacterized protein n=1 Tax=Plasmopara halstedii TaxID=4781 RepID=A0A0P1AZB0_PLAHL|nr:uncharacterized protein PHALS_02642 [Plasmopara halstedii]CEG46228.1 hypothetical protein PHALS_02642 [Plasmopara halstedii]|eukprot:XP_024582597.1 hypothetical protein PHALS_02642 [Plasmopara halstedii]